MGSQQALAVGSSTRRNPSPSGWLSRGMMFGWEMPEGVGILGNMSSLTQMLKTGKNAKNIGISRLIKWLNSINQLFGALFLKKRSSKS